MESSGSEYKIAKGWGVFLYFFCSVFTLLGIGFFVGPLWLSDVFFGTLEYYILCLLAFFFLFLGIAGLAETITARVYIYPDRIQTIGIFQKRELLNSEIKGYKTLEKFTILESSNPEKKNVKISIYLGKYQEINKYITKTFPDLFQVEEQEELSELLHNGLHGLTEEAINKKLKVARIFAYTFNAIGLLNIITPLVFDDMKVFLYINYFMLFSLIIVSFSFKGLLKIISGNGSPYPSIIWGIGASVYTFLNLTLHENNILSYNNALMYAFILGSLLCICILITHKDLKKGKTGENIAAVFVISFISFAYLYGILFCSNIHLQNVEKDYFETTVISKEERGSDPVNYYISLSPVKKYPELTDAEVYFDDYEKIKQGDTVAIYIMEGVLGDDWYIPAR
ncbi:MAG: hypothetical protein ACKOXB_13235 [Flavobacteriales bacterium]